MKGQWFKRKHDEWEKALLTDLLQRHAGNIWHIAKEIDERRSRLYKMFERHDLKPSDFRKKEVSPQAAGGQDSRISGESA